MKAAIKMASNREIIMKKFAVVLCVAALAGCATSPIPTSEAIPVPESRIHNRVYMDKKPDTGKIIVKRDISGFFGSGCNHKIFVDGSLIAELDKGEKITLNVPIGKHIVSATPNNPCGGGMAEVEATVSESEIQSFRTGTGGNGDFGIYPTAF